MAIPSPTLYPANSFGSKEPLEDKPIKGVSSGEINIPTKPKKTPVPETIGQNGHSAQNGSRQPSEAVAEVIPAKRPHPEGTENATSVKKAKTTAPTPEKDEDVVLLDDSAGGAIIIDDD